MPEKYAEIILPLALEGTLTYKVPDELVPGLQEGMRVIVQLGKNKLYSGVVVELHDRKPEHFQAKEIVSVLDDTPLINQNQIQFWRWISTYYMCTPGEVMNAALPGGLKLASDTVFQFNSEFEDWGSLKDTELTLVDHLRDEGEIRLEEVRSGPFGEQGLRLLRRLVEKGVVLTDQHMKGSYKAKKVTCIGLVSDYEKEKVLTDLIDSIRKSPAQVKALEEYARLSGKYDDPPLPRDVIRAELSDSGVAVHAVNALIKKNIFYKYELTVSRIHHEDQRPVRNEINKLTPEQERAYQEVKTHLEILPSVLLHGVTSSGKTEIYIRLIKEQIEAGRQVLYLLPEIALTTQIIKRLKNIFGDEIGVYHSKYSDNERVEVYMNLAGLSEEKPFSLILGVRSAIYLPFNKLGLIIIDEEHEHTYKQFDPAPRYHARDAATVLGLFSGAKVVLGSATPSFETLYNTKENKYGLVELSSRYGEVSLPEVIIADVRQARKRKQLKSQFTPELLQELEATLKAGKQAILFQNRRGYSNYLQCRECGYILKCANCDVSMTYHREQKGMVCHYCGYSHMVSQSCPECHQPALLMKGFGTERIEDEIGLLFPGVSIGRLDVDKMKSRKSFEKLIADFERGRSQILVGTQLVTKGLDFDNVNLVGIIDADAMMNFPDFRAFERSFQLMVQVSGRAGRRKERGKVVIQTSDPGHPVIQKVLNNDYEGLFKEQIEERRLFRYPPFSRLIRIQMRHEIPSILEGGAVFLANELKEIFGSRVLGPQQPLIGRTHGRYIMQIILKIEKEASFEKVKKLTKELLDVFSQNPVYKQIRLTVDVDPL